MKNILNTKISKQEKIDEIFRIINEYDVSNYEISKNTSISEAGIGSIVKKEVKNPRDVTVDVIYKFLLNKYEPSILKPNNTINIGNNNYNKGSIIAGNNNSVKINTQEEEEYNESPTVYEDDVVNFEQKGVPYYDVDFINGFEGFFEVNRPNPDYYIDYPPANNCEYWVNATGDSMLGVVNHGDKIALKQVDKEWFPLGEVYAIVTTNGHRMVKRVSKSEQKDCYKLVSANPNKEEYPDQDIPKKYIKHLFKVITVIKIVS